MHLLLILLVVLFYGFSHLLISLDDQGANVFAVLAMVKLACVAACLQVQIGAAADRADLLDLFGIHDKVRSALATSTFCKIKIASSTPRL
jgi:hypothetical protein